MRTRIFNRRHLIRRAVFKEYRTILRELADLFRRVPTARVPSEILVEERQPPYSHREEYSGPVLSRWSVTAYSISSVSLNEPNWSCGAVHGSFHERGRGTFVISKSERLVFLGYGLGPLNGRGVIYLAIARGDNVELEEVEQLWIS